MPLNRERSLIVRRGPATWQSVFLAAHDEARRQKNCEKLFASLDWWIGAVLAWVIWRDPNRIDAISDYHDWESLIYRHVMRETSDSIVGALEAWELVLDEMKRGRLHSVRKGGREDRTQWFGVTPTLGAAKRLFVGSIYFERNEVLRCWKSKSPRVHAAARPVNASAAHSRPLQATKSADGADKGQELLSRKGAAKFLTSKGYRIAPKTLQNMASNNNSGDGPPFDRYGKAVTYKQSDLIEWAEKRRKTISGSPKDRSGA
jgi:hypothetical protein